VGQAALSTHTDTEDLRQLRESIRGALGTTKDERSSSVDTAWRRSWAALAELGVTAFCVPESRGGYGLAVEAAVATAEELGAALHGSPYAGVVASAHALAHGSSREAHELLAQIADGRSVCAFGVLEPSGTVVDGDHASGVAHLVDGAPVADAFVLALPSSDDLVLVTDASGCSVEPDAVPFDESRTCGHVVLERAPVVPVARTGLARQLYRLLVAADVVGGVRRMLDRTVAHARERRAFGRPIGGFQAVQHRLVDHTVHVHGMGLVVSEAARLLAAGDAGAAREVGLAELVVSSGAVRVLHDLLQLTGAIGFTWEYGLHLYERRAHHDAHLAGNPRAATRAVAEHEGWTR
jgi:alkylation response protein AidB-like acyl-CoA dehydrogenase